MIKYLRQFALPIPIAYHLRKHNGIWGVKQHLYQTGGANERLLRLYDLYFAKYGSWIGFSSTFGDIPHFPHDYFGCFISGQAVVGKNAIIFQQVTIGSNTLKGTRHRGAPIIGDNVYIGAGAKIIGNVTIGDNCRIGANAVVYEDMPPHSVAVQAPTRMIQKSNLDNRYYIKMNGIWCWLKDGQWIADES